MSQPLTDTTIAQIVAMLQSANPKYTQAQIAQACGVSPSTVNNIKRTKLKPQAITLPRGAKDFKDAIRLAEVCEYLGFDTPEAASYCRKEQVDLNEVKTFKAEYDQRDIGFKSAIKQQLKQERQQERQQVKAEQKRHRKDESRIQKAEQDLARANAVITVLGRYIVAHQPDNPLLKP